jgi:uncharacterized protein (DUF2147 family)
MIEDWEVHMKTLMIAVAGLMLVAAPALSAEPIVGKWKTESGETANIGSCGSSFCVKLETGAHKGKQIGKLAGTGGTYKGEITDPANDKTYSGSGTVKGSKLSMKGCVLAILCKTQTWSRL